MAELAQHIDNLKQVATQALQEASAELAAVRAKQGEVVGSRNPDGYARLGLPESTDLHQLADELDGL